MYDGTFDMWLSRVRGVTIKKFNALAAAFGSAENVYRASKGELSGAQIVDPDTAANILKDRDDSVIASYLSELKRKSIVFMSKFDESFPAYLREIIGCPVGLYIAGEMPPDDAQWVGVIGSRRCTEYGLTVAYKFSKELAARGVVVVSGMARGIDSQSHKGAIDGGGKTVAVLGCGPDICYPSESARLKEAIMKNGCVASEYPPGVPAMPAYFPARNRIISGLSRAVIVVEAAKKSGTNITVDQALNQGRDVFAVPGNITSRMSEGANEFIKQGAAIVTNYTDILDNLGIEYDVESPKKPVGLDAKEKLVYSAVSKEASAIDDIILKTKLAAREVGAALVSLEMEGLVTKLPGQRYMKPL
ncbi:MAG: DNA-processing protein DprA [Clostridiales bacterium]|jgi:DNA processing protein|nr:DNA-processing protein DprA [Clostridiales bacterium]